MEKWVVGGGGVLYILVVIVVFCVSDMGILVGFIVMFLVFYCIFIIFIGKLIVFRYEGQML